MPLFSRADVSRIDQHPRLTALRPIPKHLFCAGKRTLDGTPTVAIVGTRRADPAAVRYAFGLAQTLANAGAIVCSGGALGIDTAAHRGTLDAKGQTLVVLASGLCKAYPPRNADLFREVAKSGAVVSEFWDVPPRAGRFLRRNQVIAALSDAVVVVQAPPRSGALSTARAAIRLGKPLWVVPAAPWDTRSGGSNELLRSGGAAPLWRAHDLLQTLSLDPRVNAPQLAIPRSRPRVPEELRAVYDSLSLQAQSLDELASETGIEIAALSSMLLELELLGLVRRAGESFTRLS